MSARRLVIRRVLIGAGIALGVAFLFVYFKYSILIEKKVRAGPLAGVSMVYAAPRAVSVGEALSAEDIIAHLRRAGYGEAPGAGVPPELRVGTGWYRAGPDTVEIFPGPESQLDPGTGPPPTAVVRFARGRVSRIFFPSATTLAKECPLEPEILSNLSAGKREKRRPVRFDDIPKSLLQAVIATEDKRFFSHSGFDPLRIVKAAWVDLRERRKEQGASTLSMQLARSLWLDGEKSWRRKALETLIALQLERKLSKKEIFEYYGNHIYLGRRGSFNLHGFGEAARAYFGKDIRQLTRPESAMLAGMIQRPSHFNPFRWPERCLARRNLVLSLMRQQGVITDLEERDAAAAPLALASTEIESTDAPYFVDLVNDQVQSQLSEGELKSHPYRIHTTLDLELQRDAAAAVQAGMREVDALLARRTRSRQPGARAPAGRRQNAAPLAAQANVAQAARANVALVALDPVTGAVKALVGGRDYNASQLNRALARRQPGSIFKPFVYAAALGAAARPPLVTTASVITDEPTTFWFNNQPYQPDNFRQQFHGSAPVRQAFARSLNVPTVKVAEKVGYAAVADLAHRAGMNAEIQPTPSIALGAYEVTPLEIAGAYTIFSNRGAYARQHWIEQVRDRAGKVTYRQPGLPAPVLDERVAYLTVNLMEDVLRYGTGAAVRARGFSLPAAGKTGTSRDGWFAGFTSRLLCVVWVGFDDNRELGLEGSKSALPIWTEFMARAHRHRRYRDALPFAAPAGIVSVSIDPASGSLAAPGCPEVLTELFLSGTQPAEVCALHPDDPKKKGFFGKIWRIFK